MNPRPLTAKDLEALRHIRNRVVHGGEPPSVRGLQVLLGYQSPRSAAQILLRLAEHGFIRRRPDGRLQLLRDLPGAPGHARTVEVPLVGNVPCGAPLLAEQNVEALIPVSTRLARPPHRYFLLRAQGNSMDRAGIHDGDLLLVRQQPTAEPGDSVVALIDDEATVKRFHRTAGAIVLEPRSSDPTHQPFILDSEFQIQGVVLTTIPRSETVP